MSALQEFPRITPFLWFDSNAEEAVTFYLGIFKNSRILDELRRNVDDRSGQEVYSRSLSNSTVSALRR